MRCLLTFFLFIISSLAFSAPILQMNRAFTALSDLIPYISQREKFMDKKNGPLVEKKIAELQAAFKEAKHDPIISGDLFAPSYALINENILDSQKAFKAGHKDYAHWRLREITTHCLDCHTRMPESHASSFQNGELTIDQSKFSDSYNLGLAQLIVRRYTDAKTSFIRDIDEKLIKKIYSKLDLPFKQLLLIDTKIQSNPGNILAVINEYINKKDLPASQKMILNSWKVRLTHWSDPKRLKAIENDKDLQTFISNELEPLKKNGAPDDGNEVDLLMTSGRLSHYLFENTSTQLKPEISYWMGWTEKYLKRDNFFGSGDSFLKQCIRRYPSHPIAKMCFEEYQDSVEFDFTGSSGTDIPQDVKKELQELKSLIKK